VSQYPLQIPIPTYAGKNLKRQQEFYNDIQLAQRIEKYINEKLSNLPDGEVKQFDYYEIATSLSINIDIVKKLLPKAGGGSKGITLKK